MEVCANAQGDRQLAATSKDTMKIFWSLSCIRVSNWLCTVAKAYGGYRKLISEGFMVQLSVLEQSPLSGQSEALSRSR